MLRAPPGRTAARGPRSVARLPFAVTLLGVTFLVGLACGGQEGRLLHLFVGPGPVGTPKGLPVATASGAGDDSGAGAADRPRRSALAVFTAAVAPMGEGPAAPEPARSPLGRRSGTTASPGDEIETHRDAPARGRRDGGRAADPNDPTTPPEGGQDSTPDTAAPPQVPGEDGTGRPGEAVGHDRDSGSARQGSGPQSGAGEAASHAPPEKGPDAPRGLRGDQNAASDPGGRGRR
jgi:hypothetical protein